MGMKQRAWGVLGEFTGGVGVECVVLRAGIPELDRKFVSKILNDVFEHTWTVEDGVRAYLDEKKTKMQTGLECW